MSDNITTENQPKKNWFLRHKILTAIGVLFVLAIIGGMGEDTETDPAPAAADTQTVTTEPTPEPEPATAEEPTEEPTEEAEPEPEPTPEPEPEVKAVKVDAGQMLKEFEGNEAAADLKYKGKTLKVTGVVEKVDTEWLDDDQYIAQLAGGGDWVFLTVNCNDMSQDDAVKIAAGEKVTVIGEFDDGGDLGVELKDCELA